MKKLYIILLLILPAILFASSAEGAEHSTDIIPRTINFIIFAAIIYYLAAKPIKDFFVSRSVGVADKLNLIQEKLKTTNRQKEEAKQLVQKAKVKAKSILEIADEEIQLQKIKIEEDLEQEIEYLNKAFEDFTNIERRKMTREVISEVLDAVFEDGNLSLKKDELLDIVLKKVA
ncbi:MAG: F0F1 ATP synthase subunit B [Epsilonproteobacteria bacterium]|nr:F0F1 ATP synthase subunit B [Campylobacterota bacterium]